MSFRKFGYLIVSVVLIWDGVSKALSGTIYGRVRMEGRPPLAVGWHVHALGVLELAAGLLMAFVIIRGWWRSKRE